MRLPDIVLDDRRFQDLVSAARARVTRTCPEWTEHNVSDPGITLIELFAWMTDMLVYRVNRVPDKLHVALLDLLGIRLAGPTAAETGLLFRLAGPAQEPVLFAAGQTTVGTVRTATDESIVFQTKEDFTILPLRPVAYVVERGGQQRDVGVAAGQARPDGSDRLPFGTPPAVGDALYLGFAEPLSRLLMQVRVECSQARGTGVDPKAPPLRWEMSRAGGEWKPADILEDKTGGFNFGSGVIELGLPRRSALADVAGQHRYWLRCRVHDTTDSGKSTTAFTHPPEIYQITAAPIGALLVGAHDAEPVGEEFLGESDGTPSQSFHLRNTPVLEPDPGETLEVREPGAAGWQRWERVDSLAGSTGRDRHFALDPSTGEISLGPCIRMADGRWRQYGAIPPPSSLLRFTQYRHGGGRRGNVGAGTLTVLKTAMPGVKEVTNPWAALGGVNPETLEAARQRAAMEIRTRYRAVTAEDFEFLAVEASPDVARAVCIAPRTVEPVCVHILPRIDDAADRQLTIEELTASRAVLSKVAAYLDKRRLLGTSVELRQPDYRGVSVVTELQTSPLADPQRVSSDVAKALYTYLNPLVGGSPRGLGDGWPFGRLLNRGELYGVVQAVNGVESISILRIYETDVRTGERAAQPIDNQIRIESNQLIASGKHVVRVAPRQSQESG
jgi:predicted phage baseplate assembly protein